MENNITPENISYHYTLASSDQRLIIDQVLAGISHFYANSKQFIAINGTSEECMGMILSIFLRLEKEFGLAFSKSLLATLLLQYPENDVTSLVSKVTELRKEL